jgi:hypothetical protein
MRPCNVSFAVLLAVVALPSFAAPIGAAPVITITPTAITATGITPGAPVLFFGEGYEPQKGQAILHRWSSVVPDAGHTGAATYELGQPVNWNALWIVADLRNGHYAIAATPGFPISREHMTHREFRRGLGAAVTQLVYARAESDFLYFKPGGAWTLTARDGGLTDADGRMDGAIAFDVGRAQPIAGSDALQALEPGGVLLVIDPMRLDLLELRVGAWILADAR